MSVEDSKSKNQLPFHDGESATQAPVVIPISGKETPENRAHNLTSNGKISRKSDRREFFIPVSGFVWLFPEEVAIVDHPAFQRLGRIYQLGQSFLVFRGATHKRLEHVLGALHVVQRMITAVDTNSEKVEGTNGAPSLSDSEKRFVRIGTLLHDIGHIAAGHTIEDELRLVSKHDEDKRLDIVIQNGMRDVNGKSLADVLNEKYGPYVPEDLSNQGVKAADIVRLLIRKMPPDGQDSYAAAQKALAASNSMRLNICHDMIGNTICADLLDYIHRDWYHVGKPRPFDERLLQYMEIRRTTGFKGTGPHCNDRFVISLGRRPKIRTDAVSNILDLLEWRYSLSETVLFHRTKLAAAGMLDRALFELFGGIEDEDEIIKFFLPLSDEELIVKCRERAEKILKDPKSSKERKDAAASAERLLDGLEQRRLFTSLSTRFAGDLRGDLLKGIKTKYAKDPGSPKAPSRNRNSVLRSLEQDFGLPRGSLAMYCPAAMNHKIAEVRIAVGDEIEKFHEYEKENDNQLTGGHLDAQLRRFDRLWRVQFFIERSVKRELGERLYLLEQAVDKLALGNLVDDEDGGRIARSIAKLIVQTEGSPWADYKVSESVVSAKSESSTAPDKYPFGAPSIRAFLFK